MNTLGLARSTLLGRSALALQPQRYFICTVKPFAGIESGKQAVHVGRPTEADTINTDLLAFLKGAATTASA
jgi:hypothetical protein